MSLKAAYEGHNAMTTSSLETVSTSDPDACAPDLTKRQLINVSVMSFVSWVVCAFGFTLFIALLPLMAKTYSWSPAQTGWVATASSVLMLFIALFMSPFMDYFGRKTGMIVCVFGSAVSCLLTGFAFNIVSTALFRGVSGFSYSNQTVIATYTNELLDKKIRGTLYGFIHSGFGFGSVASALMAFLMLPHFGWREVWWIATIPGVVIGILAFWLPESPVFLNSKMRRKLPSSQSNVPADEKKPVTSDLVTQRRNRSLYLQIMTPELRRQTIVFTLSGVLLWCSVMIFVILGVVILDKLGVSFSSALVVVIFGGFAQLCGHILLGYCGDMIGRRGTVIWSWLIAAVLFGVMLSLHGDFWATVLLYGFGLFFLQGSFGALLTYQAESFPPRVRSTGTGLAAITAPIGAIAGGTIYSSLLASGADIRIAAAVAGCVTLLAGVVIMCFGRPIAPRQEMLDD